MRELQGRVAVVTGAGSGMGRAFARRFVREGMRVVLADIQPDALDSATDEMRALGGDVHARRTDVSSWNEVEALAKESVERYGTVNVVCNNAGVVKAGPIEDLDFATWKWVLGVDLWSVIYGIKAFLPVLEQAGEGHIVNTASTAGLQAAANIAPYNVAKFGVVALTETLARELEARRSPIKVSCLCPGAVNTQIVFSDRNQPADLTAKHKTSAAEEAFKKGAGKMLAERGMDPDDVASLVVRAITEERFWIITHPEWKDVLKRRVEAMMADDSLYNGFGG